MERDSIVGTGSVDARRKLSVFLDSRGQFDSEPRPSGSIAAWSKDSCSEGTGLWRPQRLQVAWKVELQEGRTRYEVSHDELSGDAMGSEQKSPSSNACVDNIAENDGDFLDERHRSGGSLWSNEGWRNDELDAGGGLEG